MTSTSPTCKFCGGELIHTSPWTAPYCLHCGVGQAAHHSPAENRPACPDCGSVLDIQTDAEIGTTIYRQPRGAMPYLDHGRRPATVAFCTGCEFAVEIRS